MWNPIWERMTTLHSLGCSSTRKVIWEKKEPAKTMLQCMAKHLAPGGKIVIAIENRLGLKYWAGCAEDHVGKYFEGLEGYHNTKGSAYLFQVKTYTSHPPVRRIQDHFLLSLSGLQIPILHLF